MNETRVVFFDLSIPTGKTETRISDDSNNLLTLFVLGMYFLKVLVGQKRENDHRELSRHDYCTFNCRHVMRVQVVDWNGYAMVPREGAKVDSVTRPTS